MNNRFVIINILFKKGLILFLNSLVLWAVYSWYFIPIFSLPTLGYLVFLALTFCWNTLTVYLPQRVGKVENNLSISAKKEKIKYILFAYSITFLVLWLCKLREIPIPQLFS